MTPEEIEKWHAQGEAPPQDQQPQDPQSPAPETPSDISFPKDQKQQNKKFNVKRVVKTVAIIVVVIAIVGGIYLLRAIFSVESPTFEIPPDYKAVPTPTATMQDDISGWETYTNKDESYSIKYPSNMQANFALGRLDIRESGEYKPINDFYVEPYQESCDSMYRSETDLNGETRTVSGMGTKVRSGVVSQDSSSDGYRLIAYIEHNSKCYTVGGIFEIDKRDIADQILSTFKFCTPRPACLDATPRCLIPETSDMCPPNSN